MIPVNILKKGAFLLFFFLFWTSGMMAQTSSKVILTEGNISIEDIFKQIEEKTDYTIAFNQTKLDIKRIVSVSHPMENLNEILSLILNDTSWKYKITDNHILILSPDEIMEIPVIDVPVTNERILSGVPFLSNGKYAFSGIVRDSISHEALDYATVALLDISGNILLAGATNDKGEFQLTAMSQPAAIRISFIGYKTSMENLPVVRDKNDLGIFLLSMDSHVLKETTVTGSTVKRQVDRNSYLITEEMAQRASNSQELLDQIHGVRFDKVSNNIKVGNETAVLLLVDGLQQSDSYIKNLPSERIYRIEVITEPTGKYVSEGYAAIINFILKKDYTGYDINIWNFSIANPVGTNGDDWLANEQPGLGFTYTNKKFNIYGTHAFGRSRWNTSVSKDVSYKDLMEWKGKGTSLDSPSDFYKYNGSYSSAGVNYQITPDQILSFQADYTYSKVSEKSVFEMEMEHSNSASNDVENTTENETKENDYVGTVFYKGNFNDRFHLYSDFSYNYYSNNVDNANRLLIDEMIYANSKNRFKENKKLTNFNIDGTYSFSGITSLNIGYSNVWRKYISESIAGQNFLDYSEIRNKFYLYLSLNPSEKLKLRLGTALESIHIDNENLKTNKWSLQPYLQMNWSINKTINVNAGYVTNIYYPSLYQLSPMKTVIDTFMMQVGNPDLKSAIRHTASVRITLWDRLSFTPMFKYTPERISEIYTRYDNQFQRSFGNIDVKQYSIQMIYDQPIGPYFNFKGNVMYFYNTAKHAGIDNSLDGWLIDSEISYYHPKYNLGIDFGYYRSLEKSIMLHGYRMINMDNYVFSVQKQYWNKKLSIMLTYIPPISWGIKNHQITEIETPDYRERRDINNGTYKNMIFLRVALRFNSGKVKKTGRETNIEREEREKRSTPF